MTYGELSLSAVERGIFAAAEWLQEEGGLRHGRWPYLDENVVLEAWVEASLGSRVRAEAVASAMGRLGRADLLAMPTLERLGRAAWCVKVGKVLSQGRGFPFARQKTGYLRRSLERFGVNLGCLREALANPDVRTARAGVIALGHGLGPKQASFFLRQVGHPEPVAIIDVHVLAYMRLAGLCTEQRAPCTLRGYEALESRLLDYALGRGLPSCDLDRAIWVTMRAGRAN